jgi:hypothetical protein
VARWLTRGVLGLAAVSAAAWVLKWKAAGEQTGPARPSATPSERLVP